MPLPILSERLILRGLTLNDIDDLVEIVSHTSVARITTQIRANTASAGEYIARQRALQPFEKDSYYDLAIERKADQKVIRECS